MKNHALIMRPKQARAQALAVSTSEANTSAIGNGITVITVSADVDTFIEIGPSDTLAAPTATTSMRIPSGTGPIQLRCSGGDVVSAITASGTGTLWVAEMTYG